jgi:Tfp pilus assembly protein PilP
MTWKAYALLSVPGLVATYLVSTPGSSPAPAVPRRVVAAQEQATTDIQELSVKLQARVRAEIAYREPSRNPFRFSARRADRQAAAATLAGGVEPVAQPPAVFVPPPVPLTLVGMTADEADGVVHRTAIISTGQDVVLVREGDAVGRDYKVSKIGEDGVELTAADGAVRRLPFRP